MVTLSSGESYKKWKKIEIEMTMYIVENNRRLTNGPTNLTKKRVRYYFFYYQFLSKS